MRILQLTGGLVVLALLLTPDQSAAQRNMQQAIDPVAGVWVEQAPRQAMLILEPADAMNEMGNAVGIFRFQIISGRYVYQGDNRRGVLWLDTYDFGGQTRLALMVRFRGVNQMTLVGNGVFMILRRPGTL